MASISNIPLSKAVKIVESHGYELTNTKGHYKFRKPGVRTITIQSHIDPVPVRIMKQVCRHLGLTNDEFCNKIDCL
jgi:predicted RNA binding protein YcfA (HicA-like mRNA interferase family)